MRPQSRQLGFGGAGSLCSAIAGVGTDGSVRHGCLKTLSHALKMGCPFHVNSNHGLKSQQTQLRFHILWGKGRNLPTFLSNAIGPSSHSKGSPRGTAEQPCCLATMETERARRGWVSNKIQKVESGEHRVVVGIKGAFWSHCSGRSRQSNPCVPGC